MKDMDVKSDTIYFAKVKRSGIVPEKRDEDAGFDFYPNFKEESIVIKPNEIKLIPTGIASAFDKMYVLLIKERSSTGAKGMAVRMGVIDSGYRGEILIGINNTNNKPIIITKDEYFKDLTYIVHPYSKAIAQGILLPIPKIKVLQVKYSELLKFDSSRKKTLLGASKK
jgi:dUTP pyrophosphatase